MIAKAPNNPPFERKNLGFHALVGGPSFALMPSRACSNVHLSKLQKKIGWLCITPSVVYILLYITMEFYNFYSKSSSLLCFSNCA